MRSRHVSELTHTLARTSRASLQRRDRHQQALRQRLDSLAPGRRMQALLMAVSSATERLLAAAERTRHRHDAGFRALAGRLENLSPLGVLARGYALCWDDERKRLVRDSSAVSAGDRVRVTLAKGELGCVVERTTES